MTEYDFYPDKPDLIEQKAKSNLSLTIFSLVVFIMTFLLLFEDQFQFVAYLVIVLIIHELGHFITMKLFKYQNVRMLFIPLMGAFVQGKKSSYSQKQSLWVLIAGPFPGIIIGSLLLWYCTWSPHNAWLSEPAILFLLLNIINLLPLDPLDGGQMFKLFTHKKNEFFLMVFALISSLGLIFAGVYLNFAIRPEFLFNLMIVFGFLMGFRVRALQKRYQMHRDLKDENVNFSTTYKLLTNRDFAKIKEVVLEHTPALRKFISQVSEEESKPVIASQVNNVLVTPMKRDASVFFKIFIIAFWVLAFLSPMILASVLDLKWWMNVL